MAPSRRRVIVGLTPRAEPLFSLFALALGVLMSCVAAGVGPLQVAWALGTSVIAVRLDRLASRDGMARPFEIPARGLLSLVGVGWVLYALLYQARSRWGACGVGIVPLSGFYVFPVCLWTVLEGERWSGRLRGSRQRAPWPLHAMRVALIAALVIGRWGADMAAWLRAHGWVVGREWAFLR